MNFLFYLQKLHYLPQIWTFFIIICHNYATYIYTFFIITKRPLFAANMNSLIVLFY